MAEASSPCRARATKATLLARIARSLDLDRPSLGERTTWTVRTSHGVHEVELIQAVTGTRVRVDGKTVGRSPAWSYAQESFAFTLDGAHATLVVHPDTRIGTVRTALLVNGEAIRADVPEWKRGRVPTIGWGRIAAFTGYTVALTLLAGAVLGDPFRLWSVVALHAALDMSWWALVRAIDPLALLPAWLAQVTGSRAAMLLLGLEILGVIALARRPTLRARLPLLRAPSRRTRIAGWALVTLVVGAMPLLLVG